MDGNKKDALLLKYLDQSLTVEETLEFQNIVSSDDSYANEVEAAIMMNAQFNIDQKKHWQQLLDQQQTASIPKTTSTKIRKINDRRVVRVIRNVAAVFLLAVLGYVVYLTLNVQADVQVLANMEIEARYPSPVVTMGESNNISKDWQLAIKAYQSEAYQVAINLLENNIEIDNENAERHFYLGLCYLYNTPPNYQKSILYFEKSSVLNPSIYKLKTNWFNALIYIKTNEVAKAKNHLKSITEQKGWKAQNAEQLLNELEGKSSK